MVLDRHFWGGAPPPGAKPLATSTRSFPSVCKCIHPKPQLKVIFTLILKAVFTLNPKVIFILSPNP